jgi:hypothetical protein
MARTFSTKPSIEPPLESGDAPTASPQRSRFDLWYGYLGIVCLVALVLFAAGVVIGHGVVRSVVPLVSLGETWPAPFMVWHEPDWQYTTKASSILLWLLEGPFFVIFPPLLILAVMRQDQG